MVIERQKNIRSKYSVLGPGERKNLSVIESHTTWILLTSCPGLHKLPTKFKNKITNSKTNCS